MSYDSEEYCLLIENMPDAFAYYHTVTKGSSRCFNQQGSGRVKLLQTGGWHK
jgi:hypothetical protein